MKRFNKEMQNSDYVFVNKPYRLTFLEIQNSFNVFMRTLNANEVCQVRVNSRNLGFTQTWENNTKSPCPKQKRNMTSLF